MPSKEKEENFDIIEEDLSKIMEFKEGLRSGLNKSEIFSLILIMVLQIVSIATANMLIPSYGIIIDYYNVDKSLVGFPDSVFIFTSAFMAIIWGYYTDRIDRSRVIMMGAFFWAIGTTFTAFDNIRDFGGFKLLVFSRALTGAGLGSVIPIVTSILGDIIPENERSSWMGTLAILSSISNGIGQGLSSFLGPLNIYNMGWRFPFAIISILSVILIVLLFFIKIPERGSREEELNVLKEINSEYVYILSKKDLIRILKKRTNYLLLIQGFFAIIPGTLIVYFLITAFSDPTTGWFKVLPDSVRLQTSTIMAGLVGIGYMVGNSALSRLSDKLYQKDKRNRAKLTLVCLILAIPTMIIFVVSAPKLDSRILPYLEGNPNIFQIILLIFRLYPRSIIYVISAFITSFLTAAPVSARGATIMDVNLPEHRGTVSSFFALAEQLGKGMTLALSYFLLLWFGDYTQMLLFSTLSFIPVIIFWWLIFKSVRKDLEEKNLVLKERSQLSILDKIFEFEIDIDEALQYIYDAKRALDKDLNQSLKKLNQAIKMLKNVENAANMRNVFDIKIKAHNILLQALLLQTDIKELERKIKNSLKDKNVSDYRNIQYLIKNNLISDDLIEDLDQIKMKIETSFEPSDFEKIERLFESGDLLLVEARISYKYNIFEAINQIKEAQSIFDKVNRLARERLLPEDSKILTPDEKQFQARIKRLLSSNKKNIKLANELGRVFASFNEKLKNNSINEKRLQKIINRAFELNESFLNVLPDLVYEDRKQKNIEKAVKFLNDKVDNVFKEIGHSQHDEI
ncbi:MAG: MFS transporter [Promethearchaeota archaeon]